MKNSNVVINTKHYEISTVYDYITHFVHTVLYLLYFVAFIGGASLFSREYWFIGLLAGVFIMFSTWYIVEFILTYFAPLKEVEKPKEEVKKAGFFDRYKLYKSKQKNHSVEKGK